jgi:hypothetical protein
MNCFTTVLQKPALSELQDPMRLLVKFSGLLMEGLCSMLF